MEAERQCTCDRFRNNKPRLGFALCCVLSGSEPSLDCSTARLCNYSGCQPFTTAVEVTANRDNLDLSFTTK
eukprot:2177974-Amphidinium_carterae.2